MKVYSILLIVFVFVGCYSSTEKAAKNPKYGYDLGDIFFNPKTDNSDFKLCDSTKIIHRRNALTYPGGKKAINETLKKSFLPNPKYDSFSGYITIRFLLNCSFEKDRFRPQSMDFDFSLKPAPPELIEHLITIIKPLNEWGHRFPEDKNSDCSKYLNFKIVNGKIESILH